MTINIFKTLRAAALLAIGLNSGAASAFTGTREAGADTPAEHTRDEDAGRIRTHHLNRLSDRLTVEPKMLEQSCRYESDIATHPPLKRVALTFDDGPTPGGTELILEVLKKYKIGATFFMVGQKVQQHPELMAQVRAAQQTVIGNHSWDHPNFHEIGMAEQEGEVLRDEIVFSDASQVKLFRYPYGNSSCATNDFVRARGYKIVGWHIDSCDWAFDKAGAVDDKEALSCGVLAQYHNDYVGHVMSAVRAHKGGIILMHEIHPNTLKKLEEIVIALLADGYAFGTVLDVEFQNSLR
ncbi:peptidoglycan/xylan/chitin deacetylase (PgdA/CDA1 family) [Oxalobacteraceae bacterium GrIS 1.11]